MEYIESLNYGETRLKGGIVLKSSEKNHSKLSSDILYGGPKTDEYCLSILYVAMDELGMIWCMDAFMERRYKDWKLSVTFTISMAVSFYLFNFVVSGITILHTLIAYAMFFIWSYLL